MADLSPLARDALHWALYAERLWPDPETVNTIRSPLPRNLTAQQMSEHTQRIRALNDLRDVLLPPEE